MIELWGADSCPSCRQAQMLLSRTPLEFKYVDVASIKFTGEIPRLVLENGMHIVGLGPINNWVKIELRRLGL